MVTEAEAEAEAEAKLLQARREIFEHVLVVQKDAATGALGRCDLYGQVRKERSIDRMNQLTHQCPNACLPACTNDSTTQRLNESLAQ